MEERESKQIGLHLLIYVSMTINKNIVMVLTTLNELRKYTFSIVFYS